MADEMNGEREAFEVFRGDQPYQVTTQRQDEAFIAGFRAARASLAANAPAATAADGKWYMLSRNGMATLCADKADAEQSAKDAQALWPHMGPHRAVQLVEAGATTTPTEANMSKSNATGWVSHKDHYAVPVLFNPYTGEPRDARDVQSDPQGILIVPLGKVSVLAATPSPQAAQQAPAGATLRSMIEGMSVSVDVSTGDHDAGHRYFGTVTEVMECQGDKHGVTLLVQDAELNFAAPAAPSTPASGGWISVDERLPDPGTPVLLDIGTRHPIRAMWAEKHSVEAADDDTDWGEYVEEHDMYYAPEGWYEWNQNEETHWKVVEKPRAWQPLPASPIIEGEKP